MSPYLSANMTAEQAFKNDYPRALRTALGITLAVHVLVFVFGPEFRPAPYQLREKAQFEAISVPDNFEVPPPPAEEQKPEVPTEIAPSDDASADETIASTELDVEAPPELPPAPRRADFFTAYDEPPQVVKQVKPVYPDMARQAELEGVVVLLVGVDEFGNVIEATVLQSVPGLDQAAVEAVYKWKFRPAKQRDIPVPVRISIPIRFSLRG
ncbi:MAG: energy transducer TonB [Candidatus Eisenbacteria bacterium]|nr:energy transducer TonB [Candidatus Eisenbacteria bacterium]